MKVSIIIKSLNEEQNIARTIESSLMAIDEINGDGEVILADSLSTDRTLEIAKNYPIKIVQILHSKDRSCGVGAQLGYLVAEGDYLYILDADMVFETGFLKKAVSFLDENIEFAGVAGFVQDMNLNNLEFINRTQKKNNSIQAGEMYKLDGGGLYRKEAIKSIVYLTHPGLNAYEEFELGARLRSCGWKLFRFDETGVKHYGHTINAYKLLVRRVKTGYIYGIGELLQSAIGKPHFWFVLKHLKQFKIFMGYFFWFIMLLVTFILMVTSVISPVGFLLTLIFPFLIMGFKKKNIQLGVYSVISGIFNTYGLMVGFLKGSVKSPIRKLDFKWIKRG